MVQILQPQPRQRFGSQLGASLGGGLAQGLGRAADFATQIGLEKFKTAQRQKLIEDIDKAGIVHQQEQGFQNISQKFIEALPQIEQHLGRKLLPEEVDQLWEVANKPETFAQKVQQDPFKKAKQFEAAGEHELARLEAEKVGLEEKRKTEERKIAHKEKTTEASRHYEIAKKALEESEESARRLPQKEMALDLMEEAIKSENLSFFSRDNLAEITGIEGLRTEKGSLFKAAGKEFFFGNMSRIGARGLNQWLERQVSEMTPKLGRSTQANLAVSEYFKTEIDVEKRKNELTNEIAERMEKEQGFIKRNLASEVEKELRPYVIEKQKELKKKIENLNEEFKPFNKNGYLMRDPAGNLRRVSKNDYKEAISEGYKLAQ